MSNLVAKIRKWLGLDKDEAQEPPKQDTGAS